LPASNAEDPRDRPLRRRDLDSDPLRQFGRWFDEAVAAGMAAPEAVALATAARDGRPAVRMVLLKGFDQQGLRFYTNAGSRKGRELAENPQAALLFHWRPFGRQVRIEGPVTGAADSDSNAYFRTRPRDAQLSAAASPQSEPVASRSELEARVAELRRRYEGAEVPRPSAWGGFVLAPIEWEFWQHRANRLHDRFRYRGDAAGGWVVERLAP
jgi:pyridoxamine 5'-phosphate oxidase